MWEECVPIHPLLLQAAPKVGLGPLGSETVPQLRVSEIPLSRAGIWAVNHALGLEKVAESKPVEAWGPPSRDMALAQDGEFQKLLRACFPVHALMLGCCQETGVLGA